MIGIQHLADYHEYLQKEQPTIAEVAADIARQYEMAVPSLHPLDLELAIALAIRHFVNQERQER